LSGCYPFYFEDDSDLFESILKLEYEWKSPQFDTVSSQAKDLISKLLVIDPKNRLTAKEALKHAFIVL